MPRDPDLPVSNRAPVRAARSHGRNARHSHVKLSGRLIRAAVNGTSERQMVAELAKTAHEYWVEVAAPFVSDPHMIEQLRSLGVDFAQGHLIGPPVPIAEVLVADAG